MSGTSPCHHNREADTMKAYEVHGLAERIAQHLPAGWSYERPDDRHLYEYGAPVQGPEGRRINIHVEQEARLSIAGTFPEDYRHSYGVQEPRIYASATKGPERLAAEIVRRLLPAYEKPFQRWKERERQGEEERRQQDHAAAVLSEALGGAVLQRDRGDCYLAIPRERGGVHLGAGPDRLRLEFKGSLSEIRQLCELIATFPPSPR